MSHLVSTRAHAAYVDASVTTAGPARLLVMLVERLVVDVRRGLEAQQSGDRAAWHQHLVHAQDVVLELRTSLRPEAFSAGPQLAALYDHLCTRLVTANVTGDTTVTAHCLDLATQLCDTWREAALQSRVGA